MSRPERRREDVQVQEVEPREPATRNWGAAIGAGVIIVGMMIHMMMSAVFGALFAIFGGDRITDGAAFVWGMIYGVAIWAVMTFMVLPVANPVMSERVALIAAWWFIYHLIFGAMLFLTPLFSRNFAR